MIEFHLLRPWWLLALLPLAFMAWFLSQKTSRLLSWREVCDEHLLNHLVQQQRQDRRNYALSMLLGSACLMIISLSGPSWSRLPVPTYKEIQPRVIILDMSEAMQATDLSPTRLSRAKFKLRDIFNRREAGQFGLVVYSGEPFVVSPLTDDANTIGALLPALTHDVLPVDGQRLDWALEEAGKLITQAGYRQGELLVLTSEPPSTDAIEAARSLAIQGIYTSIIPLKKGSLSPLFQSLATAGQGRMIPFTDSSADIEQWLKSYNRKPGYHASADNEIPVWRDDGRWFLIPALLLLLPAFQRGWLQRVGT
ncbi:vWA domain-containing protein [Legionella londiniensis]|uniref:von Willebrand factor type A (VWA) domain-containing protein n=1 Tax=Legionella londiniensis TaxID=45068 RepID=A0A0W0VJ66_9GAMM|nr:VWA domain-containing protein [Legionella londiniensis]KTD19801.1 Von Willebrand factor type A (vWA) domain-containing protein [Legionella londiniensis]STX92288.1 TPR (repeat) domain protein [Legionella londiniensis]